MSSTELKLPLVDLDGYINPRAPGDRERVIAEVREACESFGFFQTTGHNIPLQTQKELLKSIDTLFELPQEEKRKLSYLENPCRRGYEESGMSLRTGDALPDSKEAYYIGREDPVVEHGGFYGPNVWPPLPTEEFRTPVWEYYQATNKLAVVIWEILLQGLGYPTSVMEAFTKRPMVIMKMIRYPPLEKTLPDQFGVGAHTDFGGVTVLLQQPGRDGLEVWTEERKEWVPVQALEDVYVINCGDMISQWSGGRYKSAKHRVINKADKQSRLSCATFYHGDALARNPLNNDDPNKATVGQRLIARFQKQFTLPPEFTAAASS
ncbi:2OG-Fe(II) oxygenase [Periconia macrospinosa]|uniref:2OG-Fe(II) oxygenase n=1 Tax=Periconia macrospinosa TaxID=97972 RepID=A0A2V1DZM6_9PLEO|nr:2OG-Fe(II) oxygenase [Periconia macrospinosa]